MMPYKCIITLSEEQYPTIKKNIARMVFVLFVLGVL